MESGLWPNNQKLECVGPFSSAEEWDIALCWSADDAAHYPGPPTERIAAAFYADVEPIDDFDVTAAFDCADEQ